MSKDICIVRVITSEYMTERGIVWERSIQFLKRKSHGENWLKGYCEDMGAAEGLACIPNLHDVCDGIYEARPSGHYSAEALQYNGWDDTPPEFTLVPFVEAE